jgi:DNA-binding NarL/FixJ family response regulator
VVDRLRPRVLYVEDDNYSFETARHWLEEGGFAVLGQVQSLFDAVRVVERELPDVVLLDVDLPDTRRPRIDYGQIAQFATDLRRQGITVLVLSQDDYFDRTVLADIMRSGASYLMKDRKLGAAHLCAAVRLALDGAAIYDALVAAHFESVIGSRTQSLLNEQEWKAAELISQGLSNQEVAKQLVVGEPRASEITRNILRKLGLTDRTMIGGWYSKNRPV